MLAVQSTVVRAGLNEHAARGRPGEAALDVERSQFIVGAMVVTRHGR